MRYFDFDSLIDKYATEFTVIVTEEGYFDDAGDYKPGGTKEYTMEGAFFAYSENKVFRSNGTITTQDKALYMKEALAVPFTNAKVIHNGKVYSVADELENYEFTGVYSYTLKYVSAFAHKGGVF